MTDRKINLNEFVRWKTASKVWTILNYLAGSTIAKNAKQNTLGN